MVGGGGVWWWWFECGLGGCSEGVWGVRVVCRGWGSGWGVFRLRGGLGGTVWRGLGAWDYVANPVFYSVWTRLLPRVLDWMRRRGKARTRQEVGA